MKYLLLTIQPALIPIIVLLVNFANPAKAQNDTLQPDKPDSEAVMIDDDAWEIMTLDQRDSSEAKSFMLKGYLKFMHTLWVPDHRTLWLTDNLFHNRFNLSWYITPTAALHGSIRNRFMYGDIVALYQGQTGIPDQHPGYFNLSKELLSDTSYILHSEIDRLYFDYTKGNLNITVGRQRINWGTNLVWNPNDLFNVYSYFDFDYEERPGTDAIRLQYYTGYASSYELVYKIDNKFDKMSMAGLYKFNRWGYDFQLLGGKAESDVVAGIGWTGSVYGAAFRGEATWFRDIEHFTDTISQVVASVSADYTFRNSLYLQTGVLYNSNGSNEKAGDINLLMSQPLSAKMLTRSRYNLFAQIMIPVSPLLIANMASIINPCDGSWFISPTIQYSLAEDLELSAVGQLFFGEKKSEFGNYGKLFFLRFRRSF